MWRWFWLLIWLLSKGAAQKDSLQGREYFFPSVKIVEEAPLRLKRWKADNTGWNVPGTHIVQLLAQVEGVYLRDYGGQGSLKTLSIRGMGAPLTAVSFQDLPLRAPTLGIVNLAPFYLSGLREVCFSGGGQLAVSPGAIGILSLRWYPESYRRRVAVQVGSFGELALDALYENPTWLIQAAALSVENNYDFSEPVVGRRDSASYQYVQGAFSYKKRRTQYTFWAYQGRQQVPPPIVVGVVGGPAEFLSQSQLIQSGEFYIGPLLLRLQHAAEYLKHIDIVRMQGWSHLHSLQAHLIREWRPPTSLWQGYVSLYGAVDQVWSNRMGKGFVPLSRLHQAEIASIMALQRNLGKGYIRAEGRLTSLSRFSPQFSLLIRGGIKYLGMELLRGVRFPSLWERYWVGYGNPFLPPETSLQLQLFLEKRIKGWNFYGALFMVQTRNRIVTVPLSPVRWQAYSLGYVISQGAEGRWVYDKGDWKVWGSGTYLIARDYSFTQGELLPYTPPYTASWGLLYKPKRWVLSYQGQYISWRLSGLAVTSYTILKAYLLHSCLVRYIYKRHGLEIGIENLANASYQIIQGYPMPGRRLYGRIELNL
ncbi:MAG: TonB-dependent receptor [Bacteroidia bacterium]|nr:TonB-dependent receptor [Bacteroidia bacterium]MDW8134454.1 TonB-dependent receptor [Bacteroidia bacterium]